MERPRLEEFGREHYGRLPRQITGYPPLGPLAHEPNSCFRDSVQPAIIRVVLLSRFWAVRP